MEDEVRFEDDAPDPLPVHPKAWSQREFLEHVGRRHFALGAQVGERLPAWELDEGEDKAVSSSLVQFNEELNELGWMARLRGGRPLVLQLLPLPLHLPRQARNHRRVLQCQRRGRARLDRSPCRPRLACEQKQNKTKLLCFGFVSSVFVLSLLANDCRFSSATFSKRKNGAFLVHKRTLARFPATFQYSR